MMKAVMHSPQTTMFMSTTSLSDLLSAESSLPAAKPRSGHAQLLDCLKPMIPLRKTYC